MSKKKLSDLVKSMSFIGCIGFGGGSALIPVIKREVIDDEPELDATFEKSIVVASVTPGALPVEIAAGIGYESHGLKGMLASAFSMAFPGALMSVSLLILLSVIPENYTFVIKYASVGISMYIVYMLLRYVYKEVATARDTIEKIVGITVILVVFAINMVKAWRFVFGIVLSSLCCLLIVFGIIYARNNKTEKDVSKGIWEFASPILCWLLFAVTLGIPVLASCGFPTNVVARGLLASVLSFGGGDAFLSVADTVFVSPGILQSDIFYDEIVTVVNILPGSILCKTLSCIGFVLGKQIYGNILGGILTGIACFGVSMFGSNGVFMLFYQIYSKLEDLKALNIFSRCIKLIISGMLLRIAVSLTKGAARTMIGAGIGNIWAYFGCVGLLALVVVLQRKMIKLPIIILCSLVVTCMFFTLNTVF